MKSLYQSSILVVFVVLGAALSRRRCDGFAPPPRASNSHLFGQKKTVVPSPTHIGVAGGIVRSSLTIDGATVGTLFDIVRRAVGVIPGAVMILYNEALEKAAQRLKMATMKIDHAKATTKTEAAATTTVNSDTIVLKNEATSDNWPLMDAKYVNFRASMTNAKAAKVAGEKYAKIENLEDRAFQILLDLGMVEER